MNIITAKFEATTKKYVSTFITKLWARRYPQQHRPIPRTRWGSKAKGLWCWDGLATARRRATTGLFKARADQPRGWVPHLGPRGCKQPRQNMCFSWQSEENKNKINRRQRNKQLRLSFISEGRNYVSMSNKQQGNNNSLCNPSKGAGISKYYTVVNPGQKKEKEKPGGGEARKPGRSQTQQGGHKRRPRAK